MSTPVLPKPQPTPDETLTEIKDILGEDSSAQKKKDKKEQRYKKEQLDVSKRAEEHFAWFGQRYDEENSGRKGKIKEKLSEGWNRVFKGRWFERVSGFLKSMSLSQTAGWLELLLGIFILIKTGLMETLFPILIDMAKTIITAIIKYLPMFIKFLVKLLTDVLPPAFAQIFNAVFDAIGIDKNSPLRKIIKPLSKILPWLIAFGILIAKFLPMISSVLKFISPIFKGLLRFLPHIGKLLAGLNPVGIVAIIIAAVWIFAEEIVKVYDWIIEKVFDLVFSFFPSLKPFKDVIVTMAKAFFMLTPNIYSLARLFANIKKLGFLEGFKKTIKEFLGSLADIGAGIAGFFLGWSPKRIKKEAEATKKILFGMFDKFISFLKENIFPVWTELINAFSTAFDMFADTFKEVWKEVKVIGKELYNEFSTIFSEIFGKFSESYVRGIKIFFVFFQKILKTSLSFLKPFLKFFSKIFIISFKILAVMIKALIPPFRFFISIIEKLIKGFSKLKSMFTGGGLQKTLSDLGEIIKTAVSGAFTKAQDAFESAFTAIFDLFSSMFNKLAYFLASIPGLGAKLGGDVISKYKVKSASAYAEEQEYINKYAKKHNINPDVLQKIARNEAQVTSSDSASLQEFSRKIRDMKSKGEEEQIVYLKQLVEEVKKGNTKESPAPSVTVDNKGHQVVKEGK